MALVTTVVACDSSPTSAGVIWWRSIASFSAISTPDARSSGVVGTLATPTLPLLSSTRATSVKVPPISIPIRHAMPIVPLTQDNFGDLYDQYKIAARSGGLKPRASLSQELRKLGAHLVASTPLILL